MGGRVRHFCFHVEDLREKDTLRSCGNGFPKHQVCKRFARTYPESRRALAILAGAVLIALMAYSTPLALGSASALHQGTGIAVHGTQTTVVPTRPPAALPAVSVDVSMPRQMGRTISVPPHGDLQSVINGANCGDTIVLPAGSTFTGNFTVPNKSCKGWVLLESSAIASLPFGTRVTPASIANMATLVTDKISTSVFRFAAGAHNFRFIGLELACGAACDSPGDFMDAVGFAIDSGEFAAQTLVSQEPTEIIVDRCYIHGSPTQNIRRGVSFNGASLAIVGSYISEIHEAGAASGGDSQAIAAWNGSGPFLIQNNSIEAASENILIGGADPSIPDLVMSDLTIVGNHIFKDIAWRNKAAPFNWVIKNLVEMKNIRRVLIQGNVIEYNWMAAQNGEAILLTPRNQSGGCPWCTVADVTVTYNLIQHSANGTEIAKSDDNHPSQPTIHVLYQNNVFFDISNANWGNGTGGGGWAIFIALQNKNGCCFAPHDVTIDHNTMFDDDSAIRAGDTGTINVFQYTNNIGQNDVHGTGVGCCNAALNTFFSNLTWSKNVLIGGTSGSYPSGSYFRSLGKVGFTNYSGRNYQLLPSSPYHNFGTEGKDMGVWDWATWNTDTANAINGVYPQAAPH